MTTTVFTRNDPEPGRSTGLVLLLLVLTTIITLLAFFFARTFDFAAIRPVPDIQQE